MDDLRYQIACARLQALADVGAWSPQDLVDVFLLTKPPIPFAEWHGRLQAASGAVPPPVVQEDGGSSDSLAALIDGKAGAELEKIGCLKVEVA